MSKALTVGDVDSIIAWYNVYDGEGVICKELGSKSRYLSGIKHIKPRYNKAGRPIRYKTEEDRWYRGTPPWFSREILRIERNPAYGAPIRIIVKPIEKEKTI